MNTINYDNSQWFVKILQIKNTELQLSKSSSEMISAVSEEVERLYFFIRSWSGSTPYQDFSSALSNHPTAIW